MDYRNMIDYKPLPINSPEISTKENQLIILKKIFPSFSSPKTSRFTELFKNIKNKKYYQTKTETYSNNCSDILYNNKSTKMKNFEINIERVISGLDQRTSLMIKNIPSVFSKTKAKKFLANLVKLNYLYVPSIDNGKKILGFSFVNLCDYKDIITLTKKINYFNNFHSNNNKKIEIYYFKCHGVDSLIKTFGNHTWMY